MKSQYWGIILVFFLAVVAMIDTAASETQIDIPLRTWIARPLPTGRGEAPCAISGCKHIRLAHNPVDGRIYFLGGDYVGTPIVDSESGRNEIYAYSIAQDKWTLEHPYCAASGEVQAGRPDEVGWAYDTSRNMFWMAPGYMWGVSNACSSIQIKGELMSYDPFTKKWADPPRRNLCSTLGVCGEATKFAQYDPVTDTIIQFYGCYGDSVATYDIKSDTWNSKRIGSNLCFGGEYTAIDSAGRVIYVIDPLASKLYRYKIDTQILEFLSNAPAGASYDTAMPIWDSINKVLLYPQIRDHNGIITMYIYHPDTNIWEKDPMIQPEGLLVRGNTAVFDPGQNALIVSGGIDFSGTLGANPYLFLYRYGRGAGAPTSPAAPTNLQVR